MSDYDLKIRHYFSDGVYAKRMHLKAGYYVPTHKHIYDHLSILAKGKAIVEVDGVCTTYEAPTCIEIKAGKTHTITALEDITWFCIHATDEKNVDTIDESYIVKDS